jgi:hypothetical protein
LKYKEKSFKVQVLQISILGGLKFCKYLHPETNCVKFNLLRYIYFSLGKDFACPEIYGKTILLGSSFSTDLLKEKTSEGTVLIKQFYFEGH